MPLLSTDDLKQLVIDEDRLGEDLLENVLEAYNDNTLFPLFFSPGVVGAIIKLKENIKDNDELLQIIFFLGCYVGATRRELSELLK